MDRLRNELPFFGSNSSNRNPIDFFSEAQAAGAKRGNTRIQ